MRRSIDICIGIWGFGRVGQSVAHTLLKRGYKIAVMDSDRNILSDNLIKTYDIPFFTQDEHDRFFDHCSVVIPSPGIDLRTCAVHEHRWLAELDLFQMLWKKPIIAITGSVGKTTVTSMLADLCKHNSIDVALGGNIGIAACTLLDTDPQADYAVLEVSSFQLELCRFFSPDIAIITNLYPNHLDRHPSYEDYWKAKSQIFKRQKTGEIIIAPWELRNRIQNENCAANIYYTSTKIVPPTEYETLSDQELLLCTVEEQIQIYKSCHYQTLFMPKALSTRTLPQNALTIYAALYAITHKRVSDLSFESDYVSRPHRLELVATKRGITFINDSKATTVESTLAGVERYNKQHVVLFLGGLSKGIHRESLIAQLPKNVVYVICFGAEAAKLAEWCAVYKKPHSIYTNLSDAFENSMHWITAETVMLFSPSGSSFDLYKNYEERGNHFKELVYNLPD
jgi:UDP-N-acetylmuramoylalanine--D-glutamate ligase